MNPIIEVMAEAGPWPMVHVFVPAIVSIYVKNIWILISIIYLFESAEYTVSQLPGMSYWKEPIPADALVSDILMGLVGWLAVVAFHRIRPQKTRQKRPVYALLMPKETSWSIYKHIAPYLHVIMSSGASIVPAIGIAVEGADIPMAWKFASFVLIYVAVSLLFGKTSWALFAGACMTLISLIAFYTEYTAVVSAAVMGAISLGLYLYANYGKNDRETKKKSMLTKRLVFVV